MRKSRVFLLPATSCAVVLLASCANVNFTPGGQPATTYLYVASGAAANLPQPTLTGYAIGPNGSLTSVPCPPVANLQLLALTGTGSWLFASAQPSTSAAASLSTYSIAGNGCLTLKSTADIIAQEVPLSLFVDREANTLYSWVSLLPTQSGLRSYSIDPSSGATKLTGEINAGYSTYLNALGFAGQPAGMLAFSPDDRIAVTASWNPTSLTGIDVYERWADGTLHSSNIAANSPAGSGAIFATVGAAADNAGHFVVAGVVCARSWMCPNSPIQLAIYTLDAQGSLTTQDTPQTLTTPPSNGYICGYAFSPDSRYFAVAAGGGLDVYQWNASTASLRYLDSIILQGTGFTGQLLQGFTWDRYDHLIFTTVEWSGAGESPDSGEIQVYAVSDAGAAPAPGSPYRLNSPHSLTVLNVPQR